MSKAPGPKAKGLGAELRALRESNGLNQSAVAARLGMSEPTLSRIENGRRAIEVDEMAALLAIYEVTGDRRDELLDMARTPNGPSWLQAAAPRLPDDSVTLAMLEYEARAITDWSPLLIPGLLQTMDYTSAFMAADGIPDEQIGDRLLARKRRQERLHEVDYCGYIHEAALRIPVGGVKVMRAQLGHLSESIREGLTVRVVPSAVGAHPGLIGSFMLVEFDDRKPTVHIELARSDVFLTERREVAHYSATVARLSELALDPADSVRLIDEIAGEG